jgi:hypothetical protein
LPNNNTTSNQNPKAKKPKTKNQIAVVDIMAMEQENFISRRELEKRQTVPKEKKKKIQHKGGLGTTIAYHLMLE